MLYPGRVVSDPNGADCSPSALICANPNVLPFVGSIRSESLISLQVSVHVSMAAKEGPIPEAYSTSPAFTYAMDGSKN